MQSLKIRIEGDYWDSYIYMGRLYLWTFDNDLLIVNWDDLVLSKFDIYSEEFISDIFRQSHAFHNEFILKIMKINSVHNIISNLMDNYANKELTISINELNEYLYSKQKSPFKYLTIDMDIFNKKIYAATEEGLFSSTAHRSLNEKYLVSSRPQKLWDNKLFSINASGFGQISLSGGQTGLYEYNNNIDNIVPNSSIVENNIIQVSNKHSTFSNYSFISLYNSSTVESAELELYRWSERNNFNNAKKYFREYYKKFTEEEIFGQSSTNGLSWGLQDKIYRATSNGGLEIVSFDNNNEDESYFSNVKQVHLQEWKGKVVGGGVSHFGTIIECENALVVHHDNNTFTNISGAITKWRTFPRAKNYFNQLHVIHDNCLEVHAFYDDCLNRVGSQEYKIKYIDKYLK
ncbi:hypothetical protein [Sulfurimonas sp.]|uniref:hypothetical protein n=1 Tax=Sulfurimonas sp. TaxID=2022749 RepID=UPI003563083C